MKILTKKAASPLKEAWLNMQSNNRRILIWVAAFTAAVLALSLSLAAVLSSTGPHRTGAPSPVYATVSAAASAAAPSAGLITVAHRGASKRAPENTMAAFRKAVELGADMIECDVQMSKDGTLVVIHDTKVNRTTNGRGKVRRLTFRRLRALDAGSWFDTAYRGERIPSLDEVLAAFGGTTGLLIDLKSPRLYPGIEAAVARAVKARGLDRPGQRGVLIQSTDKRSLKKIKKLMPQIPVAVLIKNPRRVTADRLLEYRTFADALHPKAAGLTSFFVERAHRYGLKVIAWDAEGKHEISALLRTGVDGVITSDPRNIHLPADKRGGPAAIR